MWRLRTKLIQAHEPEEMTMVYFANVSGNQQTENHQKLAILQQAENERFQEMIAT